MDDEEPVSSTRVTLEVTLTIIFMCAFYMGQLCASRQTTRKKTTEACETWAVSS